MTDLEFDSNEKAEEAQLHAWIFFFFHWRFKNYVKLGAAPKSFPLLEIKVMMWFCLIPRLCNQFARTYSTQWSHKNRIQSWAIETKYLILSHALAGIHLGPTPSG